MTVNYRHYFWYYPEVLVKEAACKAAGHDPTAIQQALLAGWTWLLPSPLLRITTHQTGCVLQRTQQLKASPSMRLSITFPLQVQFARNRFLVVLKPCFVGHALPSVVTDRTPACLGISFRWKYLINHGPIYYCHTGCLGVLSFPGQESEGASGRRHQLHSGHKFLADAVRL